MVTKNDYQQQLFNGDTGIILRQQEQYWAYFSTAKGIQRLAIDDLPPVETAFATTIHKSQGSEFESIVTILPADISPILSRQLLYTALTRAKAGFDLSATEAVLRHTILTHQ